MKLAPQSPKTVQELVRRLLAKNPAARPDSAAAVVRDLDRALDEGKAAPKAPPTARKAPAPAPAASGVPMKGIAAGVAGLVLIGIALALFRGGSPPPKAEPLPALVHRPAAPDAKPEEPKPRDPDPSPPPAPQPAVAPAPAATPAPSPQEPKPSSPVEEAFRQADKLFDQARAAFEDGKARSSVEALTEAGFKADEARAKYAAVQEIASDELKQKAVEQVKLVQQFQKLVHESRLAILNVKGESPAPASPPKPMPAGPAPAAAPAAAPPVPATPAPARRLEAPDPAALKDAEKTIREVYKAEYARKNPADQLALAQKMLQQARETADDPKSRFVLLREARELAAQAGDLDLTQAAIDDAAQAFDMDVLGTRNSAFVKLCAAIRTPEAAVALGEAFVELARQAIEADNYDLAQSASTRADSFARTAPDLAARIQDLRREIAAIKDEYLKVKSSIDKPGTGDQEALGKFYAFSKGDWDRGLPILAASAKPPLNTLSEKDLAAPGEPVAQAEVGDGWWDLAEKEKLPLRKIRLQDRAKTWYEAAYAGATGLTKTKIEKRLALLDAAVKGPVDLLRLVDPRVDAINGSWKSERGVLISPQEWFGRIQLRYAPPEEYDLKLVVERKVHDEDFYVGLVKGDAQVGLCIDAGHGSYTTVGDMAPLAATVNRYEGKLLFEGKPSVVLCSVRKKSITLTVDGKKVFSYPWKGDEGRGLLAGKWEIPNKKILFIGAHGTVFDIHKIILSGVSGQGHVDRSLGGGAPPPTRPPIEPRSAPLSKGSIDLLALVDPVKDQVAGDWSLEDKALVSKGGEHVRLMLPVIPPDEYDLRIVMERREGGDGIAFGLARGGNQWTVYVDKLPSEGGQSGIELVDNQMQTSVRGMQMATGQPAVFEFKVRRNGFTAAKDGKTLVSWQGNTSRLSNFPKWDVPNPRALFIGQWWNTLRYTEIRLTPVSGETRFLRGGPPPALPKNAVDLLAMIDPQKDAVKGDWTSDATGLICSAGEHIRLQIPYVPPDEYDLQMTVDRREGADGLLVGLAKGNVQWAVTMDTQAPGSFRTGFESIDGQGPSANPTTYNGPVFTNGAEIALEFRVRKAGVSVIAGGKTIIDWRGNFNRLSLPDGWKVKNSNALFLAAWGSRYHFSRIVLIPVSNAGRKLR